MKSFFRFLRSNIARVLLFALIFAVALLFALYYFGFFDISFIDRPASWNERLIDWGHKVRGDGTTAPEITDPVTDPPVTSPGTDDPATKPPVTEPPETKPPVTPPETVAFPLVTEMQRWGYRITDQVFDGKTMVLARLPLTVGVPTRASLRKMHVPTLTAYYATEDDKYYNIKSWYYKDVLKNRPSVMPYMGYILVDTGSTVLLLDSAGYQIGVYDPKEYDLAYTRDKDGRPLFSREGERTVGIPEASGKSKKKKIAREFTVPVTEYYYFDDASGAFVLSDYNELTDNRGLSFDYPAYYGIDDAGVERRVHLTETVTTALDGTDTVSLTALWKYNKLGDNVYKYNKAYAYSEGRAVTEYTYNLTYTSGGGKKYDYSITAMLILNAKGKALFRPYQNVRYQSWYQIEWYTFPDYNTEEAVGYFYYDHGLIRARRQMVDFSSWVYNGMKLKVLSDEEVLLDLDGNVVSLPAGLSVEGYSNGMILVKSDEGRYGYYNYQMLCIADPVYTEAYPFSEGLGVCRNAAGRWGVIDTEGNIVVPFAYTSISRPSSGILVLYDGAEWTVLQKMAR